jgi:hypothetical protein
MYDNFGRVHQILLEKPVMEADADHACVIEKSAGLLG